MLPLQVDSAWTVDKIKSLDNTVAEIGDIKISFADFKTIHHRISKEDEAMMRNLKKNNGGEGVFHVGWLNDQVGTLTSMMTRPMDTAFCFLFPHPPPIQTAFYFQKLRRFCLKFL